MKGDITQTSIEPLLDYFKKHIPLSAQEEELVKESFQPRFYRKRQYLLQEGGICNYLNFVIRGCLRMYTIDEKGNTHILQFATERWWITDIGSFYGRQVSKLNIDALEDSEVLLIDKNRL